MLWHLQMVTMDYLKAHLQLTGNNEYRDESYISRTNATFMPFDGYFDDMNTLKYFRKFLEDGSSGVDLPAAVILETIQGEGGINVASKSGCKSLKQFVESLICY